MSGMPPMLLATKKQKNPMVQAVTDWPGDKQLNNTPLSKLDGAKQDMSMLSTDQLKLGCL